jgi:DNA invertase Pin-like site-specific DNA recombinase
MLKSIPEAAMAKRAAIYVRVSTDKQTIEHELRELHRIAERRGWEIVQEYRERWHQRFEGARGAAWAG